VCQAHFDRDVLEQTLTRLSQNSSEHQIGTPLGPKLTCKRFGQHPATGDGLAERQALFSIGEEDVRNVGKMA